MTMTSTSVEHTPGITRREGSALATTENRRILDVLEALRPQDWTKPTDCPGWDVRTMTSHVLGMMEGFASLPQFVHQMRAGKRAAGDGPFVDGMNAVQVRERSDLEPEALIERIAAVGPRSARARGRVPGPLRRMPMKQDVAGVQETWRLGYLLSVILTRDTWMHRIDITRATGGALVLTAGHDGRIVADVVAEWARRHAMPCTLQLEGPAGGSFTQGNGGEPIDLDAIEFCRLVSGRGTGTGLLAQAVPF
jgi:uncharacterized protein (TIGR03083 family)